jgi:hypothetical protein
MSANDSKSACLLESRGYRLKCGITAVRIGARLRVSYFCETARLLLHRAVTAIRPDGPATEVLLDEQQNLSAVTVLAH